MTDKKKRAAFRLGTSKACEAMLYEFTGHYGAETPQDPIVERIAAASFEEGWPI